MHGLYQIILFTICLGMTSSQPRELNIGALLELNGNVTLERVKHAAIDLAVQKIQNNWDFPINYVIGNSGCTGQQSIGEFAKLKYENNINAIIGPSCNDGCVTGGKLATYHNMVMISHSCSSAQMSNNTNYPTFGRVRAYASASPRSTTKAIVAFANTMKWQRIGIIHGNGEEWSAAGQIIRDDLKKAAITVLIHKDYIPGHSTSSADACMRAVKDSKVRILLLIVAAEDVLHLANAAKAQGMYNGKYVFISLDLFTWDPNGKMPNWLSSHSLGLLQGWFDISSESMVSSSHNAEQKQFLGKLQQRLMQSPFYMQVNEFPEEVFYLYDAVIAYSLALKKAIDDKHIEHVVNYIYNNITKTPDLLTSLNITNFTPSDVQRGIWPGQHADFKELRNLTFEFFNYTWLNSTFNFSDVVKDGRYVAQRLFKLDFYGVSGRVKMNSRGNRYPALYFRNFLSWNKPVEVASFDSTSQTYAVLANNYTFPGLSKILPPDQETCGFLDDKCDVDSNASTSAVLIAIFAPIISLIVLAVLYRKYKKRKFENDIFNNKRSFLKYSDLIFQRGTMQHNTMGPSFSLDDLSSLHNESLTDKDFGSVISAKDSDQKKGSVALYKHQNVFVKRLPKRTIYLDRDILLEIKLARDIHHTNVNPYLGVIVEPPRICLVSPYCTKGSLRDILANEDITLDWVFRLSFTADIAMGMGEIHETIGPMGNLTSYNVLVDRRWTCRIADYGLERFKEPNLHYKPPPLMEEEKYKRLLWKAPELLSVTVNKKSKPGDVYAYGIILSEIITRMLPYENYGYPAKDVIHFVQRRCLPPFRPHVRLQSGLDGRMLDLMRRCWHEFPAERPTFHELRKPLKSVIKDRQDSENLVDNMLEMMEKYTNHLERRVVERTEQLRSEKEKVESLLYTMLPKSIAQRLKMGELILPEHFHCVSLMLSDIVDFSSITATSTPLQVVDVLNDLTKIFDNTIERLDAFKYENYNEKFSVVSGCPKKNGIRHVRNIAMLALKIMSKMTIFRMRHRPHQLLRLRICCHVGNVVGGLVGIRTPKYCVYGDSISYITHLESTGPPLRIQISPDFKEKLNEIGGFETVIRGPVRVKGRGLVVAHFLTGKEGMDFELPEPEPDKGIALNDLGRKESKGSGMGKIANEGSA